MEARPQSAGIRIEEAVYVRKKGWILVLAFAVGAALFLSTPERRVKGYFRSHQEELTQAVARWQMGERLSFDPGLTVNIWDGDHQIVEYLVTGRGFGSSCSYYGFFYSPDGVPVSFQNSGEMLHRLGQYEWSWQGEGDNRGRVELLLPNWYYFEASL